MNKIGTNITQTPPESRGTKAAVVTQFKGDRRSVSDAGQQNVSATVALSSQAVDLSALESRIKNLPDIDAARVVELHNRIVAGDYEVDSNSIASKMMSFENSIDRE
ncbi:MAG: flagellar biosynthesis anti-sigma factor FlgM [Pseudohongiellaceae bacterium]